MNYYNEYDKPMYFKGDILITDPCYIMRDEEDSLCKDFYPKCECPNSDDYLPYGPSELDYPDIIKIDITLTNTKEDINKGMTYVMNDTLSIREWARLANGKVNEITFPITMSPSYESGWESYQRDLKKYYSIPHDDWDYCDCGENVDKLGISTSAIASTLYGDWGCTTYEIEDEIASATPNKVKEKPLGEFCADAGLVGVFLVDEVMKYNPKAIENLKNKNWCATFINNFDGNITFAKTAVHYNDEEDNQECEDVELRLVGDGNIKFVTAQTSL